MIVQPVTTAGKLLKKDMRITIISILTGICLIAAANAQSLQQNELSMAVTEAVIRPQAAEVISAPSRAIIEKQSLERARVWVFLTDKGISNKAQFDQKAAEISLPEKSVARRKLAGVDRVLFIDLPVVTQYVERIRQLGGEVRRVSKWLNAVSVDIDRDKIDQLATLPFVAEIKPTMAYMREPVDDQTETESSLPLKSDLSELAANVVLDYDSSFIQLDQLNIPAVHRQGYSGEGITLCIIDTGYRKTHAAFAEHYADSRVLDEYDFINDDAETSNEIGDLSNQWNHGTSVWSACGGYLDGVIYGPAYKANFLLAKTEDNASERPIEEDNWVAALEWADSLGADVITTSLGYMIFDYPYTSYVYADLDGATTTTAIAASTAASLGIVISKSMGNSGPAPASLSTPADAFDILAVGSVTEFGTLSSFSSRGPTADGRTKPEVCARGQAVYLASTLSDNSYARGNGTSYAAPLIGGLVCLVRQARPDMTPLEVREAIIMTADRASSPDNNYGWGIANAAEAIGYGIEAAVDSSWGKAPFTVNFTGSTALTALSWTWHFGDGDSAVGQNVQHTYSTAGAFDVVLTVETADAVIPLIKPEFVAVVADSFETEADSAYAGQSQMISIDLRNQQSLTDMYIPLKISGDFNLVVDSVTRGDRSLSFDQLLTIRSDADSGLYIYRLRPSALGLSSLEPGDGEIMRLYVTADSFALGGQTVSISTDQIYYGATPYNLKVVGEYATYQPDYTAADFAAAFVVRGDVNNNGAVNISDVTYLVEYLFGIPAGPPPLTLQQGDVNKNLKINIADITYLVAWLFGGGPPIPQP